MAQVAEVIPMQPTAPVFVCRRCKKRPAFAGRYTCDGCGGWSKRTRTRDENGRRPLEFGITENLKRGLPIYDGPAHELAQVTWERPRTRGECEKGPRPCPWVGCRYHLGLEVLRSGNLFLGRPLVLEEYTGDTCALDVAERTEGATLEEVARHLGVTRERVRQIEDRALKKLERSTRTDGVRAAIKGEDEPC